MHHKKLCNPLHFIYKNSAYANKFWYQIQPIQHLYITWFFFFHQLLNLSLFNLHGCQIWRFLVFLFNKLGSNFQWRTQWLLELSIDDHFHFIRSMGFGWRWFPRPTNNKNFNLDWCKSKGVQGEIEEKCYCLEDHSSWGKQIYLSQNFWCYKAKDAWEILQKEFQASNKAISVKLQNLWRDFDNLTRKETESVKDFNSRVAKIVNQIKSYRDTIQEKKLVKKIL